jgi:exosortase
VSLALDDNRYSYLLLVPLISVFLLWLKKEDILKNARYSPFAGLTVLLAGMMVAAVPSNELGFSIFGMLLVWVGIAVVCYGIPAVRKASFPLLFLFFAVPAPSNVMDQVVVLLQKASADVTAGLYRMVGIPFQRDGFVFSLSTVEIEVAKECSGIRSCISMFLSCILAGHMFLRSGWTRVGFALLSIPVLIFKNAVRIVGITWLGLNVDPGFFTGTLHKNSGMPFTLLAVGLLLPALWALRRIEQPKPMAAESKG